jgi:transcriptional regulator with XRE-family HTH domain
MENILITRIREVRRARKLTLDDVAKRCVPPTTPQTIGRLETGTRTLSIGWLNRIAAALGVDASDLVDARDAVQLNVAAILDHSGARAPERGLQIVPLQLDDSHVAIMVQGGVGDYRAGDEIWCRTIRPEEYGGALNRDVLVPRPAGRFIFGRMINRDAEKLQILPLEPGGRQQIVANPPWIAVAVRLMRAL